MKPLLALVLPFATLVAADPIFTGKWRITNTLAGDLNVLEIEVKNGSYRCPTCSPPIADPIPMDGKEHKSAGPLPDQTVSITVFNERSFEVFSKSKGQPLSRMVRAVSPDGKRYEQVRINYALAGEVPSWTITHRERVGQRAPGAHIMTGSWKPTRQEVQESAKDFTYEQTSNGLKFKDAESSYDAKFDGKDYPAGRGQTVTIKRIDAKTVDEIWKLDGKEFSRSRMTLSADGKTLSNAIFDGTRRVEEFTATRQ